MAVGEARVLCRQVNPREGAGRTPHCEPCHSGRGAELATKETWSEPDSFSSLFTALALACFLLWSKSTSLPAVRLRGSTSEAPMGWLAHTEALTFISFPLVVRPEPGPQGVTNPNTE